VRGGTSCGVMPTVLDIYYCNAPMKPAERTELTLFLLDYRPDNTPMPINHVELLNEFAAFKESAAQLTQSALII
jgi:hypothetical protein